MLFVRRASDEVAKTNLEIFTWGPNDDRRRLAPFVARRGPFVSFSGMVAAVGVVLWVVVVCRHISEIT
jgi:hypothetical protein